MANGPKEDKEKLEKDYNGLYNWYGKPDKEPNLTMVTLVVVVIISFIVIAATIIENLNI